MINISTEFKEGYKCLFRLMGQEDGAAQALAGLEEQLKGPAEGAINVLKSFGREIFERLVSEAQKHPEVETKTLIQGFKKLLYQEEERITVQAHSVLSIRKEALEALAKGKCEQQELKKGSPFQGGPRSYVQRNLNLLAPEDWEHLETALEKSPSSAALGAIRSERARIFNMVRSDDELHLLITFVFPTAFSFPGLYEMEHTALRKFVHELGKTTQKWRDILPSIKHVNPELDKEKIRFLDKEALKKALRIIFFMERHPGAVSAIMTWEQLLADTKKFVQT